MLLECEVIMNTNTCNETLKQTVFTHSAGKCIEADWGGCETRNKFETKLECDLACGIPQEQALEQELNNLSEEALDTINEILHVIEEDITTEPQTTIAREAETQPETEPEPEAETEAESEPESETDSPEVETTTESAETTTNLDFEEVVNT